MYDVAPSPLKEPFKWKICDTVGLLPDNGLSVSELLYLVDGNIPNRFQVSCINRRHIDFFVLLLDWLIGCLLTCLIWRVGLLVGHWLVGIGRLISWFADRCLVGWY